MKRLVSISAAAAFALALSAGAASAVTGTGFKQKSSLDVASGPSARPYAAVTWHRVPRSASQAWNAFLAQAGGTWQVLWDSDTGVPSRIFGSGISVPGSVASPAIAETYARSFLARHIDLLAPGSRAEEFVLASNHLDHRGMRTVGLIQHHHGMRVLGGQVSFRFKNDRLSVIGSESLPHVRTTQLYSSLDSAVAEDRALAWIETEAAGAGVSALDGPYILPIISRREVTYHTVLRVTVEAETPIGLWQVYVDAATGDEIARQQMLLFASGTVLYDVPKRHPRSIRHAYPAQNASLVVDGISKTSNSDGLVNWTGDRAVQIGTTVKGPLVLVDNVAGDGTEVTRLLDIEPGGTTTWTEGSDEVKDAQLTTFVHANLAKEYSRRFAPNLEFLDDPLPAKVNMSQNCNAYWDGTAIHFFSSDGRCQNTGRLADVIYHEFGHALHTNSIIPGVGDFDGAFSEGLSDYLAATITGDPGMGRGFFYDDSALRHLDPSDKEYRWPDDIDYTDIHITGKIFAGAMWDLRKELIVEYGAEQGVILADQLFYAAVQRATSIPTTYVEILAADDNDNDLSNGTPNECIINKAFGLHGLRKLTADFTPLGTQSTDRDGYDISFSIRGLTARCPDDEIASATLHWGRRVAGTESSTPNTIQFESSGAGIDSTFSGRIPGQDAGTVVRYKLVVELKDGTVWNFPTNLADRAYEFYVGDVIELYCTMFNSNPFDEDWTHGVSRGDAATDDWQWAIPGGVPNGQDPVVSFTGDYALGNNLDRDISGHYPKDMTNFVKMPVIDVGRYSDVRLQYRRWLTVEDAKYDQATIYADDKVVWQNLETESGIIHHLDAEWVSHDVLLSRGIFDGDVQVTFELTTDKGLEFGGWTIDDVCIVARPDAICGDRKVVGAEECDNGDDNNNDNPNACRTSCHKAFCGDGVRDNDEECDDGNLDPDDNCSNFCTRLPGADFGGCGCAVGQNSPPAAPLWLFLAFVALLAWQRGSKGR
ncbi:MAG: DUF4215 domain-containing protein [Proteobacteria bacterium]|nr:DUF4215 domain-containing protein [Pseudomonadota bacterium]